MIRDYRCTNCGDFELQERITDDITKKCPNCDSNINRVFQPTLWHFNNVDTKISKERVDTGIDYRPMTHTELEALI